MTLRVTGLESSETQDTSEESGETVPCKKLDLKSKELLGKHGRQGNKLCLFFFFFHLSRLYIQLYHSPLATLSLECRLWDRGRHSVRWHCF